MNGEIQKKEYPLPTDKKTMNAASKYSELVLLGKVFLKVVSKSYSILRMKFVLQKGKASSNN